MFRVRLTNRASAAGARHAGAPRARSFYPTPPARKRNSSLLGRARQLQALVRRKDRREGGRQRDKALVHGRRQKAITEECDGGNQDPADTNEQPNRE